MSKTKIGAQILYCGHNGTFIADVTEIAGAVVVRAPKPINLGKIDRSPAAVENADYHLSDFPMGGFWRPDLGTFVVPTTQLTPFTGIRRSAVKALFVATIEVNGEPPKLMSEDMWLKCLAGTIESQIKEMLIADVIVTIHTGQVKQ